MTAASRTVSVRAAYTALAIVVAGCSSNPATTRIGGGGSGSPLGEVDAASEAAPPHDASSSAEDAGPGAVVADANEATTADAKDKDADVGEGDAGADAGPGPYT